jgi:hypothetical protein
MTGEKSVKACEKNAERRSMSGISERNMTRLPIFDTNEKMTA